MGTMFKLSRSVIIGWQYEVPGREPVDHGS